MSKEKNTSNVYPSHKRKSVKVASNTNDIPAIVIASRRYSKRKREKKFQKNVHLKYIDITEVGL